jgi:hypothetical protein
MAALEPGRYAVKALGYEIGKSAVKGTMQVGILLQILEGDHRGKRVPMYLYFTDKTYERSVETLRTLGWKGTDIRKGEGIGTAVAEAVVDWDEKPDPKTGQKRLRVAFINRPGAGGFGMKAMGDDEADLFASRIADLASTVPEREAPAAVGGSPVGTPDIPVPAGSGPDDDIPFLRGSYGVGSRSGFFWSGCSGAARVGARAALFFRWRTTMDRKTTRAALSSAAARVKLAGEMSQRKRAGNKRETTIEPMNDEIERRGWARVIRCEPKVKVIQSTTCGRFEGVFETRGSADYVGFLLPSGKPIAVEVKNVSPALDAAGRLRPPRFSLSHVPDHQRRDLALTLQAGGVAVLLVGWTSETFAVPWALVQDAILRGERHLGPEVLRDHVLRYGETWLEGIRRFERRPGAVSGV